jgi:hypothetical protein
MIFCYILYSYPFYVFLLKKEASMEQHVATQFLRIARNTLCPYASSAHVYLGPAWETNRSFQGHVQRTAQALTQFCEEAFAKKWHGFVMEIVAKEQVKQFDLVKRLFFLTLKELNRYDPNASPCMDADFLQQTWQFEFARTRLFVSVFAPCYPVWHTKYSYALDRMFLFFQPDYSFDFCGVDRDNIKAKTYIRRIFQAANRPYNGEIIDQRIEALIYMSPLALDDPPVQWWIETTRN